MEILIAGDFCPNARLGKIDFTKAEVIYPSLSDIIQNVDYSIVNFECPVVKGEVEPLCKQGPNLKCSSEALMYLKRVGFSAVTLANNHIRDFGDVALLDTIKCARDNDLDYVGAGTPDDPQRGSLFLSFQGRTVAIINCCESEFSVTDDQSVGANALNPIRQFRQIAAAKADADFVVVIVHGGVEHFQYPTPRMKDTYRFFVEAGADAVVNHHQHCYSGYEEYLGKPIFYGLGNFCFDWDGKRRLPWNEGFMVSLSLNDKEISYKLYPYIQCDEKPIVELMDDNASTRFNRNIDKISDIIKDDKVLQSLVTHYYSSTEQDYRLALEPYSSRIGVGLYRRNLLPSFVSKQRVLKLIDFIKCESHRDRLEAFLNRQYTRVFR